MAREFRTSPDFKTAVLANGAAGTSGQVLTSAGAGAAPSWTTVSGGGGGLTKFTEAESTSSPNATVYVDSLTAAATSTNADVALVAKGSGATLAQVPDGTAAGGNKRGAYATDLQKYRSLASYVASGNYSTIGGGWENTAAGQDSVIAGGRYNNAGGTRATITGGEFNIASSNYSFVGGGYSNTAQTNTHATVCGGNGNTASGQYSFVGGGQSNIASTGTHATVCGGQSNTASEGESFVGGGRFNVCSGLAAFIGGGASNSAYGSRAAIAGGAENVGSGHWGFIGGGQNNSVTSSYSVVCGGLFNTANSQFSFIGGGASGTTRSITGYHVFPACYQPISSTLGSTQSALLLLGRQTTNATATVLTSNQSAASTTNQVILPNNSAYSFSGEVIAGVTGAGDTARWEIKGAIKRGAGAGTTAMVGTPTVTMTHNDAGAAAWVVNVTADTTNGGIKVEVTGAASTTIRWVCRINTVEVTY